MYQELNCPFLALYVQRWGTVSIPQPCHLALVHPPEPHRQCLIQSLDALERWSRRYPVRFFSSLEIGKVYRRMPQRTAKSTSARCHGRSVLRLFLSCYH